MTTDVNRDINAMWPYQRMMELAEEGYIGEFSEVKRWIYGRRGDQDTFRDTRTRRSPRCLKRKESISFL